MNTQPNITNIQSAIVLKGQRAWTKIKATAEEQRVLWLEVGVALMWGKQKDNREEGQKFSDWVQEMFPGLVDRHDIADALWCAENYVTVTQNTGATVHLTHPSRIRRACMEAFSTQALPPELQTITPETSTVLPKEAAVKINKLFHRSTTGDEGSGPAARHLKAFAKQHGIDVEQLVEAAAIGDPDGHHRFSPTRQAALGKFKDSLLQDMQRMEQDGISKEAIRHILINIANSL